MTGVRLPSPAPDVTVINTNVHKVTRNLHKTTNPTISFKNDKYKKARGGYSRLLDISCASCGNHLCYYQKDGPGILKRMYLDRITGLEFEGLNSKNLKEIPQLICAKCRLHIGIAIIYEKENRLAYRLFVGAVSKKVTKSH